MKKGKIWRGRFTDSIDEAFEEFSCSLPVDKRMADEDIDVNRAWIEELSRIGVLEREEEQKLLNGLDKIEEEFASGEFTFKEADEDIHTALEKRLGEITNGNAGVIRTGRSRNDLVMTDLFLYLRKKIKSLINEIERLEEITVNTAEENFNLIMPGYTHLQPAQPTLFCHYLLSLFWLANRDRERLLEAGRRCGIMPLGAGALAGSSFPVDRKILAKNLGFHGIFENSVDAVSHRDILLEVAFNLTLLLQHLSRYSSDLILWASPGFNYISLDDAYSTGSSIMPQKKNPDSLELIRARASSAIGSLFALFSLLRGLPHTYNRDLQDDKKHVFSILDDVNDSTQLFCRVLETTSIDGEAVRNSLNPGILATEMADYLTLRGIPFGQAHLITGKVVAWCENNGKKLNEISLQELKSFSPLFERDVFDWLDYEHSINRREITGGTGRKSVKRQIEKAREVLRKNKEKNSGG